MRNQRGIPLIALVITIIVLLILAGVSIAMLTGENGILTKATESQQKSAAAEAEEALKLALSEILANKLDPSYEGTENVVNATNIQSLVTDNNSNVTASVSGTSPLKVVLTIQNRKFNCDVDPGNGKISNFAEDTSSAD